MSHLRCCHGGLVRRDELRSGDHNRNGQLGGSRIDEDQLLVIHERMLLQQLVRSYLKHVIKLDLQ